MKSGRAVKCSSACGPLITAEAAEPAITKEPAAAAVLGPPIITAAITWPKSLGAFTTVGAANERK